jgi:transcriptional regulator with XRE-family HTH domain
MKAWALQTPVMAMHHEELSIPTAHGRFEREAQELIRDLGRWTRSVRELLGFSQDRLAKLAGVSQGAISRVEAGKGIATPMVTFWKINQVFVKFLSQLDPLSDEARGMLERARFLSRPIPEHAGGKSPFELVDPVLARLISTYHTLPEQKRQHFLHVLDATALGMAPHPPPAPQPVVHQQESPIERAARTPN